MFRTFNVIGSKGGSNAGWRTRPQFDPDQADALFYPRYACETVRSHFWMGYWILKMNRIRWRIKADAAREQYCDVSLSTREAAARAAVRGTTAPSACESAVSALAGSGSVA
jgi:hypothetical protein